MAPAMIFSTWDSWLLRIPRLHLVTQPARWIRCARCDGACPMSLDVSAMVAANSMQRDECILCHNCVDVCPKDAIGSRFGANAG
jgi:ferredoxin-type protein NapH